MALRIGLSALNSRLSATRFRSEPQRVDLDVEAEVAFARAAGVEAEHVGNLPGVAEVLHEAVGLFVEAAFAGVVVQAGQQLIGFIDPRAAFDGIVLDLIAQEIV